MIIINNINDINNILIIINNDNINVCNENIIIINVCNININNNIINN